MLMRRRTPGLRFSTNAVRPSLASSERNSRSTSSASRASPSSSGSCAALVHAALDRRDRELRPGRQPLGVLARPVLVDERADEAPRQRLVGPERAAGEQQVHRARGAEQPREPLRAAVAGQQPERDLRRAELVRPPGAASRTSHASAISSPPPSAWPLTYAMNTCSAAAIRVNAACDVRIISMFASTSPSRNFLTSAPAEKNFSLALRTITTRASERDRRVDVGGEPAA